MDQSKQLLEYAKRLLQEGRLQESEAAFHQVISSGQYAPEGLYGFGLVRLGLGDLDGAAYHFKKVLQQNPQDANVLYQLGGIAERRQFLQEARSFYKKTLEINPQHVSAGDSLKRLANSYKPVAQNNFNEPNTIKKVVHPAMHRNVSLAAGGKIAIIDDTKLFEYGIYGPLLQDPSSTSQSIIRLIDDLRMKSVHPTFTAFLGSFLSRLFFVIVVGLGAIYMRPLIPLFFIYVLPVLVLSILCLLSIIMDYAYINTATITIDKGRLQITRGVFNQKSINEELWRVHGIELRRTLLNRLTGDGTLIFKFEHMAQPFEVRGLAKGARLDEIYQQLLNLVGLLRSVQALKGIIQ